MHRLWLISLTLLPAAYAQAPSTDSQTLQILLGEVRQLRQELKTTTVTIERAQILLYRLQAQETATGKATDRLDDARARLAQTQTNRGSFAKRAKTLEDKLSDIGNPIEKKQIEDEMAALKTHIETVLLPEEQQRQARVTDCEQQMRLEQDKLSELQQQLEQIDAALKNSR